MKIFTVYVQFRSKSKNTSYYFFTLSARDNLILRCPSAAFTFHQV